MALTREQIVAASLQVADREGPDALGIRRVARELGVTPMALYRYVASKDALLGEVRDFLWTSLELEADGGSGWRSRLRSIARAFRRLVAEHPAAARLLSEGSGEGQAERRVCDLMLGSFRAAGFDPETAETLYVQFAHFVLDLVELDRDAGGEADGFELGLDLFLGGVDGLRRRSTSLERGKR